MIEGKRVIVIIPARGGSKRLPRKNILPLAGKPLITWSIDSALNSQYVDQIFVSTDDQEIADVVCEYGLEVPELRPKELASDTSSTLSVLKYTLEKFGSQADLMVLLQPTSPLRTAEHIDQALEIFISKQALSVISVTPCEHSPLWANTLPEDNTMKGFIRSSTPSKRSQDLEQFYRLNGSIYIYDVKTLLSTGSLEYTKDTYAYKMDNIFSVDIDTQFDLDLAEFIISREQK